MSQFYDEIKLFISLKLHLHVVPRCHTSVISRERRSAVSPDSDVLINYTPFSLLCSLALSEVLARSGAHASARDAYLTAPNSPPRLRREETIVRLCPEGGFYPSRDLCKDTSESAGLLAQPPATPPPHPSLPPQSISQVFQSSASIAPIFCCNLSIR